MSDKDRSVRGAQSQQRQAPPGAIDEDQELEQYGVWVKVGPEDYEETGGKEDDFSLTDFDDEPTLESLDDNITEEEEELLSSLEEPGTAGSTARADSIASDDFEDFNFDSEESLPEIPDEDLPDLSADDAELSAADAELSSEELSFDLTDESDLFVSEENDLTRNPGSPRQEKVDFDLDSELEIPEGEEIIATDEAIDEPEELQGADEELSILEPSDERPDEFDLSDLELSETERMVEDLPELDLSEEDDGLALGDDVSVDFPTDSFDDVGAVELEMTEPADPASRFATVHGTVNGDESLSILHTIEKELASIKEELGQLKRELSSMKAAPSSSAAPETHPLEHEITGFFDEEEDETIALTGDELDNILNTAEFTEEAGKPTEIDDFVDGFAAEPHVSAEPDSGSAEVAEDFIQDDEDLLRDTDLEKTLYEEAEVPPDELPIEEISLDDDFSGQAVMAGEGIEIDLESETEAAVEADSEADFLKGDDGEVDALARMDIESELAEIEELDDETEEDFEFDSTDLDIDLTIPEAAPAAEEAFEIDEPETEAEEANFDSFEDLEEVEAAEDLSVEELADEQPSTLETLDDLEELVEEPQTLEDWSPDIAIDDESRVEVPEIKPDRSSDRGQSAVAPAPGGGRQIGLSDDLKSEIKTVLGYMDKLLEALPEEKIQEFARSDHFIVYKRLFEELGLEQ
ncbi:MAG TPA: hypothetical protein VMW87_07245 [Spirochaetia bacterium]|nr:hypothetical protein [Spirochaetia bacterium]